MRKILTQAAKEWCEFRRDRMSVALAFVLPLATLLLFGFGVRLKAQHVGVMVQDLDNSSLSRKLTRELFDDNTAVRQVPWDGRITAEQALADGKTEAVVVIPDDFEDDLAIGARVTICAYLDGSDINSAQAMQALQKRSGEFFCKLASDCDSHFAYLQLQPKVMWNPQKQEALFIVPGVFGIILYMYPALLAAVAAARENELGTGIQARMCGLPPASLLLGRIIVYAGVGAVEAALVVGAACAVFGLHPPADLSLFVLTTLAYIFCAVSFGVLAGTLSRTQTAAVQVAATGGFFPSLLLSGFLYPIANIPKPLSLICWLVPARFYIETCRGVFLRGAGWSSGFLHPLILLAFTAASFSAALTILQRRAQI